MNHRVRAGLAIVTLLQVALLGFCLVPPGTEAALIKWSDRDGKWTVPGNWTGNTVPGFMDDAVDDIRGTVITQDDVRGSIFVKSLTLIHSVLNFIGTLIATNGVMLDDGALNVGFTPAARYEGGKLAILEWSRSPIHLVTF
jgi:hypothetical protein